MYRLLIVAALMLAVGAGVAVIKALSKGGPS